MHFRLVINKSNFWVAKLGNMLLVGAHPPSEYSHYKAWEGNFVSIAPSKQTQFKMFYMRQRQALKQHAKRNTSIVQ